MRRIVLALAVLALLMTVSSMQATSMPAATVGGSGNVEGLPGYPIELGFRFTPTINLSVTALGTFTTPGAPPSGSEIGLFGPGSGFTPGTLLSSVSFPSTSTSLDGFSYIDLSTPVTLTAGTAYTILAYFPGSTYIPIDLLAPVTFNSDLMNVNFTNSYLNPGDGLTFLGTVPGGLSDYSQFGPNFLFQAAGVPEPAAGGLVGLGLIGLLACTLWRKRVAVPTV